MTAILILFVVGTFIALIAYAGSSARGKGIKYNPKPTQPAGPDFSMYRKRDYLFDTNSEFYFFKTLQEIVGNKYYVFPQMNYSHLVGTERMDKYSARAFRSKIDKKSADYVICDKQQVIPKLVIELDGSSHGRLDRITRDRFIDGLLKDVGLHIIHFDVRDIHNKKLIEEKIYQFILR